MGSETQGVGIRPMASVLRLCSFDLFCLLFILRLNIFAQQVYCSLVLCKFQLFGSILVQPLILGIHFYTALKLLVEEIDPYLNFKHFKKGTTYNGAIY